MTLLERINQRAARSRIGRYFKLEGSGAVDERAGTSLTMELRAGLATFVAMAYIISVNSTVVTESGGPCDCGALAPYANATQIQGGCVDVPEYMACLDVVKKDMITATVAISAIGTFLVGVLANLPLGLAPGMGLNAYFAYTVVGFHGTGSTSYRVALAAVFIEGIIFLLLSILGIRQWLARIIPQSIKVATGAGIGMFLAFLGLQSSAGMGLIAADPATLVTLGGCPPEYMDENQVCQGHGMESARMWLGIGGFVMISLLLLYRVKGSILIGILLISIISWPRSTAVTNFPYTEAGNRGWEYFKQVVDVHPIQMTAGALEFDLTSGEIWVALITFLYVDILDTTGTMFSMAKFGGYMDERGDFAGSTMAFCSDALAVSIGALLGTPPITTFVESGAGITEGGRTGITAISISFLFILSLFFSPIFASIPGWATGPALVIVGSMMARSARDVNWDYLGDAVPAFLTMALMPLTYSIAYGLIGGICSYIAINSIVGIISWATRGRIRPDQENKESWQAFFTQDGKELLPEWMGRASRWIRPHEVGIVGHEHEHDPEA
ncbi:MAG: permease family-domain-containing protein [Piptocephalis tieghemiana]|nr:MAG: permease family-domain-containing protein [Piptocephalis tieghemiana]